MFKKLQKKFIITFSLVTFLVMLLITLIINITFITITVKGIKDDLTVSIEREKNNNFSSMQTATENGKDREFLPRTITVIINEDGSYDVRLSEDYPYQKEEIIAIAEEIIADNQTFNRYGNMFYYYSKSDQIICFLEAQSELQSINSTLSISSIVALSAVVILSLSSIYISFIVIKPYEDLYQKEKNFMTDASHELKTPLAIINANCDASLLKNKEDQFILNIKKQNKRLTKLIEEIIILNKSNEYTSFNDNEEINVTDQLYDAIECYKYLFIKRNIKIETDVEENVLLKRNQQMFDRYISIFFDNASKYTLDNGVFKVTLKSKKKNIYLSFFNTVSMISNEEIKKLFDRFYTCAKSRDKDSSGFGIGLSIAQEIAKRYNDDLKAITKDNKSIEFIILIKN